MLGHHVSESPTERSPKYDDIVTAAQELFGEVGYDKTGVREIAERAHIALGTLYSQFPDGKNGVLRAAMTDRVQRLQAHIAGESRDDPVEAFLGRARRLSSEIVRDPFLRRVFLEQGHVNEPRLRQHGRELLNTFGELAVAELTRLADSGMARCDDPQAVAMLIRSATIGWIAAQASGTDSVSHDRVSHDRLLDVLMDSIRTYLRPPDKGGRRSTGKKRPQQARAT